MNVLITGASGFIGSHLTKVFCRRHAVSVLVRQDSNRDFLRHYPITLLEGDLRDRAFLTQAAKGFDLVIHAGGKVNDWGSYPDFLETNVQGSLNLLEALSPGTRLIFFSSIAVLGEEDCRTPKDEESPYKPVCPYLFESWLPSGMNHYRLTKTLAEQMLIQKAEISGLALTVIRPVWVFGPREFHAGPYEYCKSVQDGLPALPGSWDNLFHVIFVEDLARLTLRIAEAQRPGIQVYNAGQPEIPLMSDYWKLFCQAMGLAQPRVFPPWLLYPLALLLEILWTLAGARNPPLLTRARLYLFAANNVYSAQKVCREFAFHDFTPLPRAVRKTVRWWKLYKYLS